MLCKRVSIGHTLGVKDSGFRIRVQRDLRQQFIDACRAEDKSAAQVIREYMRTYVARRLTGREAHQPSRSIGVAEAATELIER